MTKIKNILKNQRGLTLVELVVAMTLSAILMTCAVIACVMSFRLYSRSTAISEGGILKSTLYYAIADELRYAQLDNMVPSDNAVTYKSAIHGGVEITMKVVDGSLLVDDKPALSQSVYAGYKLKELIITKEVVATGCVEIKYSLEHVAYGMQEDVTMVVRTLN